MRRQQGFNLVELLVTVAIISILGSIGYSSYSGYMVDARRSEATNQLLQLAQTQEKYYGRNNNYADNAGDLGVASTTPTGNYSLSFAYISSNNQTYTLTATPVSDGAQAGDSDCSSITLNSNGSRAPTGCW